MSRVVPPSQQKLAEKLTILNDRMVGLLTRLYQMKKYMSNTSLKPRYLHEKAFEGALKALMKKFPNVDTRSNTNALVPLANIKADIMNQLAIYYHTLVDILELKDHVNELLTRMDAYQVFMHITLNFDVTKNYLDLVANYVAIMILLSRIEERKAIVAIYNYAYELCTSKGEKTYPRLSQMLLDYESPLRKLHDDFVPHSKCVARALLSLTDLHQRRNVAAENWRSAQCLNLLAEPHKISTTALVDTMACEILSLETMERWIVLGFLICYPELAEEHAYQLFKQVLVSGYVITLFRDEVVQIHPLIQQFFETIKNYSRRASEVREWYSQACALSPQIHRERRKYLLAALKELTLIFSDNPGLLGPKALIIFMALMYARDELHWLVKHACNPPPKKSNVKVNPDDYKDRYIPELMFYMEELRELVRKYHQIIQQFHILCLSDYDVNELQLFLQRTQVPEEEATILTSFANELSTLSVKDVQQKKMFDFRGIRLDWFRLQAYTTVSNANFQLKTHIQFAGQMNSMIFHTKMVDFLDEVLRETSDLSLLFFYPEQFDNYFKQNIEFPAQHRYIIVFPLICAHFMNACHPLCPEERPHIGESSFHKALNFLKLICTEIVHLTVLTCDEQSQMNFKLLPRHSTALIVDNSGRRQSRRPDKRSRPYFSTGDALDGHILPGDESIRFRREDFTKMDKYHMALTELCFAINHARMIQVWDKGLAPREMLMYELQERFCSVLAGSVMFDPDRDPDEIAKPSELLNCVRAQMIVLQDLERYAQIDMSKIFGEVFLQHTQPRDRFRGKPTITSLYTCWYIDSMLKRANADQMVFSPLLKTFITVPNAGGGQETSAPFHAEEHADLNELKALAELVGPYGMRYMAKAVMKKVTRVLEDMKKMVHQNRSVLESLRVSFDDPDKMRDLSSTLTCVEPFLKALKVVGIMFAFRHLSAEALNDVLQSRTPFLMRTIDDMLADLDTNILANGDMNSVQALAKKQQMLLDSAELSVTAGCKAKFDPVLYAILAQTPPQSEEEDYRISCLLFVFAAVAMPRLARLNDSVYRHDFDGHFNNIHCIPIAICELQSVLFMLHGRNDHDDRAKEFLALASSSLLRMDQELSGASEKGGGSGQSGQSGQSSDNREGLLIAQRNRDSVYILLDLYVQREPTLTMDLLESCFPYALIRNAYHNVRKAVYKTISRG